MTNVTTTNIPIYEPYIGDLEKQYVSECLDSSWISSRGKYISLFEDEFAKKTNIKYASTVSNGTVALHLAILALGIGPGDEVIVPTFTYIASVNAIKYAGATPVFVDSLIDTWQIDPSDVEKKITKNTRAIMAVHLYGHPCDMYSLSAIAKEHNIFLIEDCAEAFGTKYDDQHVGSFGDIATYSFFGNKTITTGEGGMVVSNNETLINRVNHLKGQGLADHRQYWHDIVGYNYRLTNVACAIGFAQLQRADEFINRKREIAKFYKNAFENTPYEFHKEANNVFHSYWMCSILIDKNKCGRESRDNLRKHLTHSGIETRPLFYPVHTMPMYHDRYQNHQIAEDISRRGINLPSYPQLTEDQLTYIINSVLEYNI
jgi:perosamine synthetase